MPWRNGLGSTTELVIAPEGASLESFDFRLSIAQLAAAAPFSRFPGVDRWLLMLEGSVRLAIGEAADVNLDPTQSGVEFAGEQSVTATPLDSPAKDLNLMVRRGRYRGALRRLGACADAKWRPSAAVSVLLCRRGSVAIDLEAGFEDRPEGPWRLGHDDVLLVGTPLSSALALTPDPGAQLYLAELFEP